MFQFGSPNSCSLNGSWAASFVAALPAFWRLCQCIRRYRDDQKAHPHLTNALKYFLTMIAICMSIVFNITGYESAKVLWIIFAIFASVLSMWWDIIFDWGLFQPNATEPYLRNEIVYPKTFYYAAIPMDIILRLGWIFLVFPSVWSSITLDKVLNLSTSSNISGLIVYFLALVEVCRRIVWALIRLENEHVQNVGQFRAIKDVPLPFPDYPRTSQV